MSSSEWDSSDDSQLVKERSTASHDGGKRPGASAFAIMLLVTASTTYPFVAFVNKVSNIDLERLRPCSDRACTFIKIFADDGLPSTWSFHENPFRQVRNGDPSNTSVPFTFSSPSCRSSTGGVIQAGCASAFTHRRTDHDGLDVRPVRNTLAHAPSKLAYLVGVTGWFCAKAIHDVMVLQEVAEDMTLKVGLISIAFQSVAVGAVFVWSMAVTSVFRAPVAWAGAPCSCYYILPTLDSVLSFIVPALLYKMHHSKSISVVKAASFGDYLYFMQYDVPHRFMRGDPTNAFVIVALAGDSAVAPRALAEEDAKFRRVAALTDIIVRTCKVFVDCCAMFAIGPLAARCISWGLYQSDRDRVTDWLLVAVVTVGLAVFLGIAMVTRIQWLMKAVGCLRCLGHCFLLLFMAAGGSLWVWTLGRWLVSGSHQDDPQQHLLHALSGICCFAAVYTMTRYQQLKALRALRDQADVPEHFWSLVLVLCD